MHVLFDGYNYKITSIEQPKWFLEFMKLVRHSLSTPLSLKHSLNIIPISTYFQYGNIFYINHLSLLKDRNKQKNVLKYFLLTWVSVTFNSFAISALSLEDRYFFISNCFSSSKICRPVNVVLAFFLFALSPLSWSLEQFVDVVLQSPRVELRIVEQLLLPFKLLVGLREPSGTGSLSWTKPAIGLLLLLPSGVGLFLTSFFFLAGLVAVLFVLPGKK